MESLRAVVEASKSTPTGLATSKPALSEIAEEILAAVQSEQDPDQRGVMEILDSLKINQTFFFAKLTDSGNPYSLPTQKYRRAIKELISERWLDEPEDEGNLRLYRYTDTAET
jgi:hypothetical protein